MKERHHVGRLVEVSASGPQEPEICHASGGIDGAMAKVREIVGKQEKVPGDKSCQDGQQCGRQYAPYAAIIETGNAIFAALHLGVDLHRDHIAADHEEDVDANEAARHAEKSVVEAEYGQHRDGAQAIYVRTVICFLQVVTPKTDGSFCPYRLSPVNCRRVA